MLCLHCQEAVGSVHAPGGPDRQSSRALHPPLRCRQKSIELALAPWGAISARYRHDRTAHDRRRTGLHMYCRSSHSSSNSCGPEPVHGYRSIAWLHNLLRHDRSHLHYPVVAAWSGSESVPEPVLSEHSALSLSLSPSIASSEYMLVLRAGRRPGAGATGVTTIW